MPKLSTGWIITTTVFMALLLPSLVQQGMFLDGVSYASIARNMAEGKGSFSSPHYTESLYPVCYEQPPLGLWLQSLFFRVFGDHFWVERFYCLIMALSTAKVLQMNWVVYKSIDQLHKDQKTFKNDNSWLAVLIWICTPVVFWAYSNNMLECTMSLFVLLATWSAGKWLLSKNAGFLILSAIFTAMAVLTKGPVGFFPLVAPVVASITLKQGKLMLAVFHSFIISMVCIGSLMVVIRWIPGMAQFTDGYLQTRLLPTLGGVRDEFVSNRFHFLIDLISQLALPLVILSAMFLFTKSSRGGINNLAWFFLAMGLTGSFPLMLSPKQSLHYLVPSISFFAIGMAMFMESLMNERSRFSPFLTIAGKNLTMVSWLVFCAVLLVSGLCWGKFKRDELLISEITNLSLEVPANTILGSKEDLAINWTLVAYLSRIANISLDSKKQHEYFLTKKNENTPLEYQLFNDNLTSFRLWKRLDING